MPYDYKKLKAARELAGMTQEQLSVKLKLTSAAISLVEKGLRQSPPTILAYAKAVRVPMRDIVISDEEFDALRAEDEERSRKEPTGARR